MAEGKAPIWLRVIRVHREKGLAGVWYGVLARAGCSRLTVLERRLDEPLPQLRSRAEAEIRQLRRDEVDAVTALTATPADVVREQLDRGNQCWGARCDGALRHVEWVAFVNAWVEHLGIRLALDEDVAYVYRAFTETSFRGRGLTQATQAVCLPLLRRQGFRLAVCAVAPENPWALTPWLRVGYRRLGVIVTWRVGGWRRAGFHLDRGVQSGGGWRLAGPGGGR